PQMQSAPPRRPPPIVTPDKARQGRRSGAPGAEIELSAAWVPDRRAEDGASSGMTIGKCAAQIHGAGPWRNHLPVADRGCRRKHDHAFGGGMIMERYEQTLAQLRSRIESGRIGASRDGSDRLPPERDLAAELGVGRRSLRRALGVLEEEG